MHSLGFQVVRESAAALSFNMSSLSDSYGKDYRLSAVVADHGLLSAFSNSGIATTIQLLERCRSQAECDELATELNLPQLDVRRLVSICDLMRINGIGPAHAAELVEHADVYGLLALRDIDPVAVRQKLDNEGCARLPAIETLKAWKKLAASIPLLTEIESSADWERTSLARTTRFSLQFIILLWGIIIVVGLAAYLFTRSRIATAAQLGMPFPELLPAVQRFALVLYDRFILAFVSMASGIGLFLLIPVSLLQRVWMLFVDRWARFRERVEYVQLLRYLEAKSFSWDSKMMRWTLVVAFLIAVSILIVALSYPIPDITPYLDRLASGEGPPMTLPGILFLLVIPLATIGMLPSVFRLHSYPGRHSPTVVRYYMRRTAMKDFSTLLIVLLGLILALEVGQRVSGYVAERHYRPHVQAAAERLAWTTDLLRTGDPEFTIHDREEMGKFLTAELRQWDSYLDEGWRALSIAVRITGACLVLIVAFLIVFEQLAIMLLFLVRKRRTIYLAAFIIFSILIPVLAESYLRRLLPFENISWIVAAAALGVGLVSGMLPTEGESDTRD